ncbi:MAG: sugar ABC transporter permease [Acholeplasmatales bacterium]|nr:sugar ABC transporter permease [Acholeplasmatales bacterium]
MNEEVKPKRRKKWRIKGENIFVFLMLIYPVLHFLIMWIGVNINSILLTFQSPVRGKLQWNEWNELFFNYETLFDSFKQDSTQKLFMASGAYFIVSCLVTLPVALFFSYFIFKKIAGNKFFKIIFYIPSILPLVILTLVFSLSFSNQGLMDPLLEFFGGDTSDLFIGDNAKWMVWIFCIWAGIGYDVILLTSGMSRIPRDILESCKMDGVSPMREFFKIIIPLTWPTITTLFVLGMMSVFNVYLQPFFLTSGNYDTMTIGLQIYQQSGGSALHTPATLGLFCSLIGAPIILTVRGLLNKKYEDVSF